MPYNYFNPGTWQPAPFNPGGGGDQYGFNPAPSPQPRYTPDNPYAYMPQPTPGAEQRPYVPSNASGVLPPTSPTAYMTPGVSNTGGGLPSVGGMAGLAGRYFSPFSSNVREGWLDRFGGLGATALGVASGVPLGGLIAGLLYDKIFNAQPRDPERMEAAFGPYWEEMGARRNAMQSRQRPGSTRFSQGEMDLSNLPMYGAPGSLMPAVFAGQRRSILPDGQTVYEQAS